jgi:hypothetical protein
VRIPRTAALRTAALRTAALRTAALSAAAPLVLAVIGLFHPQHLTPSTADRWAALHVVLLPVFPLLGAGFFVLLWRRPRRDLAGVATVVAWVSTFVYAAFYTGLDAVAGIAAGTIRPHAEQVDDPGSLIRPLHEIGGTLGHVGVYAFGVAAAATSLVLLLERGPLVLPGAAAMAVSIALFLDGHVFYPKGVVAMLGIALGFVLLSVAAHGPRRELDATRRQPEVSSGGNRAGGP